MMWLLTDPTPLRSGLSGAPLHRHVSDLGERNAVDRRIRFRSSNIRFRLRARIARAAKRAIFGSRTYSIIVLPAPHGLMRVDSIQIVVAA